MNRTTPMPPEADVRETPPELFEVLNARFRFTMDACATHANTKVPSYYCTEQGTFGHLECCPCDDPHALRPEHGLTHNWKGERVWLNPPFSNIASWVLKAWESEAELVVMLVPATRTEQGWWHDGVEPFRDGRCPPEQLPGGWDSFSTEFLQGRTHFLKDGQPILDPKTGRRSSPKFGCVLLVWIRRSIAASENDRTSGAGNGTVAG